MYIHKSVFRLRMAHLHMFTSSGLQERVKNIHKIFQPLMKSSRAFF